MQIEYTKNFIENIYSKIYMFKDYVQNIIKTSMEETNANVATSMIYGDTTELDETIQKDFEDIGVSHLMSVSGTHIASFMLIINLCLGINKNKRNKQQNKRKILNGCIQIFSILTYMTFTGFNIAVMRAGIMLIIAIVLGILNKRKNKYIALVITLLIVLFQNPYSIFNTGMRLSFLATLGILLFSKNIIKIFEKIMYKIKNVIVRKVAEYIVQNMAITIAVQLLIIPVQIQAFNKLPFPVIIPNLILGILSAPIRIVGTIGIMLSFVPQLSSAIFSFLELLVMGLVYIAKVFKNISFSISSTAQPTVFYILYYLLVISMHVYFKINGVANKEGKYNFKKTLKYIKTFQLLLCILLATTIVTINIYSIYISEYVYFFNVEQGDMSYIKSGTASAIVDIGSLKNNLAFNTISNYFKISNLSKVDVIIISHMHKDHMNGLEQFIKNYKVGTVIYSKPKMPDITYQEFKELLNKYSVNSKEVKAGDKINIGNIKIEILLPSNEYINAKDNINANSLICKITVNDRSMLYMGDGSKETEEKLIKEYEELEKIYILKVGHHGSKSATGNEFVQKIQPQNAVISALKKYYGHPHKTTIDVLNQNNIYTYLTEKQGAIRFNLK